MVQIDTQQPRRRRMSSSSPITPKELEKPDTESQGLLASPLFQLVFRVFALSYGLLVFIIFCLRGFYNGCIANPPKPRFWEELEERRQRQYDLSKEHPSGLHHAFWTAEHGLRLHFLTNSKPPKSANAKPSKTKNLIIFIHGWPDTSVLWTHTIGHLPKSTVDSSTVVAFDLPGFGGSDAPNTYGANQILPLITEFCMAMRAQYLDEKANGQVLCVCFDWGTVIGFRLAAEAPEIADRFILSNAPLYSAAFRNVTERVATASKMFSLWKRNPTQYNLLMKAYSPLKPVLTQIGRSYYVFIFRLPWIFASQPVALFNLVWLRLVHSLAVGYKKISYGPEVMVDIAAFMGPPISETAAPDNNPQTYGATVVKRAAKPNAFRETIRYYREGLATDPWDKELDVILKLSDLHDHNVGARKRKASVGARSSLKGALGVPATIIWGERDIALDHRITLEGIDEYLTRDSQVIRLPKIGHWVPRQGEGPAVLATVIGWALKEEDKDGLATNIIAVCSTAKVTISK